MTRALAILALGLAVLPGSAQESQPALEKIVERANHVSPYVAAQGIKALDTIGLRAIPEIQAFITRRSRYALSPLLVTWLGGLPSSADVDGILTDAVQDAEFPWRPMAAKALVARGAPGGRELWTTLLSDRLPAVREAAAAGWARLGRATAESRALALPLLREALRDPAFEPRLAAAAALLDLGDRSGIDTLSRALTIVRRFFVLDFGEIARRKAWEVVAPLVGADCGYDPGVEPLRQAAALREVRRRLGLDAGADSRPESAPLDPDADLPDVVFGMEVRSCRRGDAFLRVTAGGDLVLGHYDLGRKAIPKERFEALRKLLTAPSDLGEGRAPRPGEDNHLGRPGCEFERDYFPDERGLIQISVGLDGRPPALQTLVDALVEAIDACFGPKEAALFEARLEPFARPDEH